MGARRLLRLLAVALVGAACAGRAGAAEVRGRLVVDVPGLDIGDVGPVVVYLEAPPSAAADGPAPAAQIIRQRNALFSPPFLTVARGQTVEMPNDDDIFHNVFSFSAPNEFDLGFYPAGHSRSVRFLHPGVVRIYCSIHESMNATIFVAPTPWFARADAGGRFAIPGVPEGRWRLRTWSEMLPATERMLEVGPGVTALEIGLMEPGGP